MRCVLSAEAAAALESRFAGPGNQQKMLRELFIGAGLVEATLVSLDSQLSEPTPTITLVENMGVVEDCHACTVTGLSGHDTVQRFFLGLPKGAPKANLRQVTIVSREEGNSVAAQMGLPADWMPAGMQVENMIVTGLDGLSGFSNLSPGTLLAFLSPDGEPRTPTLYVTGPNVPCAHPQRNLRQHFGDNLEFSVPYAAAARSRRGLIAVVETGGLHEGVGGQIYAGDIVSAWRPVWSV